MVHTGTGVTSSPTQPPPSTTTPPPIHTTMMEGNPPQRPWENPGAVAMLAPLSQLPTHPEKWLPKSKLNNGQLAEEHINNFMLSINLNGVTEEDIVVRLFPYILQEAAGSWYFLLPYGSINNWDTFQDQFLMKFGDDRSTTTLINYLSNLKVEPKEPINDFNSHFNKLLNKIPAASKPSNEVKNEWYISALPSNLAIFVDRATKPTLAENMKEEIVVEKRILAVEKKNGVEERKSKKVSFRDDSKKKQVKDPFDQEGLQKVLKTMSNEMVYINKQVEETSFKKPYRPFKRNPLTNPKPPNAATNFESEREEEEVSNEEQTDNE